MSRSQKFDDDDRGREMRRDVERKEARRAKQARRTEEPPRSPARRDWRKPR